MDIFPETSLHTGALCVENVVLAGDGQNAVRVLVRGGVGCYPDDHWTLMLCWHNWDAPPSFDRGVVIVQGRGDYA
jgi:hypothetical protein